MSQVRRADQGVTRKGAPAPCGPRILKRDDMTLKTDPALVPVLLGRNHLLRPHLPTRGDTGSRRDDDVQGCS
jgi:hypothetical protein